MRSYRKASQPGHKMCNRCDKEMPATAEFFLRDKSRADGLAYECRECHRARKAGRDRRADRWSQMSSEQKIARLQSQRRYNSTPKGRAIMLRKAYMRADFCDLSVDEMMEMLAKPCSHCGTTDIPRGLDRIDNSLPHVKGNVAPACAPCNFARGDRFTFDEMQRIGDAIREVMRDRDPKVAASAENLGMFSSRRHARSEHKHPLPPA